MATTRKARVPMAEQIRLINEELGNTEKPVIVKSQVP